MKIRPIVSDTSGPTTKLSWLLSRLLIPLLQNVPAHLKSSMHLIDSIKNTNQKEQLYPCSFDVISMYTSIPIPDAIQALVYKMEDCNITNMKGLTIDQTEQLLHVILRNTYFQFDNNIFLQVKGLPMGSSLSGVLAIIFMDSIETVALRQMRVMYNVPLFMRYVDDCFAIIENKEQALKLLQYLNAQHSSINFEIELPDDNKTLSLLDFRVTLNAPNEPQFEFYRKSARKDLFVNYHSHVPYTNKINFIRNEKTRIAERCSNNLTQNRHRQFQ